ncbi:hypothetical protein [Paraprevotella clara]|uniref:hypothetical protein n=1 Tax=Paraprevotella clara TaxID=454154 RepID=UPI0025851F40|nr:hypothetical protein [Paraprevotella clara]
MDFPSPCRPLTNTGATLLAWPSPIPIHCAATANIHRRNPRTHGALSDTRRANASRRSLGRRLRQNVDFPNPCRPFTNTGAILLA